MMSKFGKLSLMWCALVTILSLLGVDSLPATTSEPTTHIVSFVKQKKLKPKFDEFPDFDFESIRANGSDNHDQKTHNGAINLLVGRLVQQLDTGIDNNIDTSMKSLMETPRNSTKLVKSTDDAADQSQNTLENDLKEGTSQDDSMAQNSSDTDPLRNRVKQSIPVLEPVKHLLNTVRDGAFNHTSSSSSGHHTSHSKHHHQLVGSDGADSGGEHHDSAAIETEEEREMVNESTGFHFLELLGTIAGMVWGFFTNIQKFFAASSGTASAASSGASR